MAGIAAPVIGLAGSLFNGIFAGNRTRRVGEMIANTNEGASNDILAATGAGQGAVANAGNQAITAVSDARDNANNILNPYASAGMAGTEALTQMATNPAKFTYADYANDPAFQFEMDQGTNAINHSAAARGLASSGNVLKDLTRFGQGLAATYYNDAFNRYMQGRGLQQAAATTLAGQGLNAAGQQANNYMNTGQYVGNTGMDVANFFANFGLQGQNLAAGYRVAGQNARGAGLLGQANAVTGMVNQAAQTIPQIVQPILNRNAPAVGTNMASLPLVWQGSTGPRNPLQPW
jgi:hypothetical protein